jgi:hypothetical protein
MLGNFIRAGDFKPHHAWDRKFILGFSALTWVISIWGFAPGLQQVVGNKNSSLILYIHIITFFSWLVLFSLQASLVSLKRTGLHKIVGSFGACLAVAMLCSGITLSVTNNQFAFDAGHPETLRFMIVPLMVVIIFFTLVVFAIIFRKFPAIHKRLMLLAVIELLVAPLGRKFVPIFGPLLGDGVPNFWFTIYNVDYLLILLVMGYDWSTRGTVHRIYWVAVPLMLASHLLMSTIYNNAYWPTIAQIIIGR